MKKIISLILATIMTTTLFSCDQNKTDTNEVSVNSNEEISTSQNSVEEVPRTISNSEAKEIVNNLGYLLNSPSWNDTSEIKTGDLVMWYACYKMEKHSEDEFYMSKYLVDGKDGLSLPADEIEPVISQFFNISPDVMREDFLYNEQIKTYTTMAPLGPFPEMKTKINDVSNDGETTRIEFSLSFPSLGVTTDHILIVSNTEPYNYISYVEK